MNRAPRLVITTGFTLALATAFNALGRPMLGVTAIPRGVPSRLSFCPGGEFSTWMLCGSSSL